MIDTEYRICFPYPSDFANSHSVKMSEINILGSQAKIKQKDIINP